ncbi:hypothetical protein H2200_011197 [Cladophialophora chaetospira]|uniref:Uncharacterized protein n=1 Tax=Cladophialophora chaetospira TaxID=386627 RepID=A0AA38X085_9EURO|nr:hypothetical protein H2200_011197 [Cladophialophora chaetospira]
MLQRKHLNPKLGLVSLHVPIGSRQALEYNNVTLVRTINTVNNPKFPKLYRRSQHPAANNRASVHTMAAQKSILSMGITVPPELQGKIDAFANRALEAGYDIELLQFDPDNFAPYQKRIEEKLGSKRWDGVMIGFGVRGNPKLTEIFETLVNSASEAVPGVKFGFAGSLDDVFPCLVRNFGRKE